MSFYRSDPVNFYRLVIPRESAWDIMNRLGQQPLLHIVPSQTAVLTRPFLSHVRRCQDGLYRLRSLEKVLQDKGIYNRRDDYSDAAYHEIFRLWDEQYSRSSGHPASVLNDILTEVDHAWSYHQDLSKRSDVLASRLQTYRDNIAIIKAGQIRFGRDFFTVRGRVQQMGRRLVQGSKVSYKSGVIRLQDELRFKRTVFRITKGNSLVVCVPFRELFDNLIIDEQTRVVFYIVYPGANDSYLERKLTRLVENFCQDKYELPNSEEQLVRIRGNLESGLVETDNLLSLTQGELTDFLNNLSQPMAESQYFRRHEYLKLYLIKQKDVYSTLNQMELYSNFMQGKVYVRSADVQQLQRTLIELEQSTKHAMGQLVPAHTDKQPTHFQTNSFTCSAQQIVQTYGVANYQQANPAFFTVITFPFLFGVMFGDIGHGAILLAFGLYMVFGVDENTINPVFKMVRPHRYMFTLMGFFSVYCGLIYNDYLSLSLNLFGSCYDVTGIEPGSAIPLTAGCVYPIGVDPVWSIAQNNLIFLNSLKMKISVIIAVVHMTLGVFVKASNTIHFCKWIDFIFEFIPQLLFLVLLFGYMDFLIVYKWTVDWTGNTANAPSIITTMINLPLKLGKTENCCGGQPMWGQYGTTNQNQIQLLFLVIALICIPWMLLPKPLIMIYCSKKGKPIGQIDIEDGPHSARLLSGDNLQGGEVERGSHQAHEASSEIFVHQLIETIEYVLGCISNTASYLRLWALSLAHSQLSQVFFDKLVEGSITSGFSGIPMMIIGFIFLAGITFGVLLCMDSMECFLHTLRLHWVEFNNKFYKGSGYSFVFYSFRKRVAEQVAGQGSSF